MSSEMVQCQKTDCDYHEHCDHIEEHQRGRYCCKSAYCPGCEPSGKTRITIEQEDSDDE